MYSYPVSSNAGTVRESRSHEGLQLRTHAQRGRRGLMPRLLGLHLLTVYLYKVGMALLQRALSGDLLECNLALLESIISDYQARRDSPMA